MTQDARERHQRVSDLFLRASRVPHQERAAFLEEQCGEEDLRREVEEMLELDVESDATPVPGTVVGELTNLAFEEAPLPKMVGPYRILDRIGQGGMGVVYRARQQNPDRIVALKVIRSGFASGETLKRFAREAMALGRLTHPGIARIFEAGTAPSDAGSQPFFAMEYVEGLPITTYAAEQDLDPRGCLRLLASVCEAVHHAHQADIVHRDLKPANILVTEQGQVKVLDFGIARAQQDETGEEEGPFTTWMTEAGQVIGTLPYMSPEQVAGARDLDRRADVYSLGVIGYELLSGTRPLDVAGLSLARASELIRDQEPSTLGTLDSRLRGDIETLVAKALEKDPKRRFPTALDLARDIERFLSDKPIHARPPSVVYQMRKYARRNRALLLAMLAILIASGIATGVSWKAAKRASRAATAAELEARKAEAVNDFLIFMLDSADPFSEAGHAGSDVTVSQMLDRAVTQLDRAFIEEPEVEFATRLTISNTFKGLSRYDEAQIQLQKAQELLPSSDEPTLDLLRVRRRLAVLVALQGDNRGGHDLLAATLKDMEEVVGPRDEEAILARVNLGWIEARMGELDSAERTYRKALEVSRSALPSDHETRVTAAVNLAACLREADSDKNWQEALQLYREAQTALEQIYSSHHPRVAILVNNIARLYLSQGDDLKAAEGFQDAADRLRASMSPPHPYTGTVLNNLGYALHNLGELERADEALSSALAEYRASVGEEDPEYWSTLNTHAFVLFDREDFEGALAAWSEYAQLRGRRDGPDHPRVLLAQAYAAESKAGLGRFEEAETETLEIHRRISASREASDDWTAAVQRTLVRIYERWDKPEKAASFR